jgi:hypothetical protein
VKWTEYNQMLVRRGEILLGFDVNDNWGKELKDVNGDKSDEPFQHPNTFLLLLGHAKAYFHLPYLQTEGTANELVEDIAKSNRGTIGKLLADDGAYDGNGVFGVCQTMEFILVLK